VYGLQARGLDGKQDFCTRIEDMAAHYIKEIRTLQPRGPYFLSGFCFGGTVVFEMAQQLQAQGQQVALLALFDTYGPGYPKSLPKTTLLYHKVSHYWDDLSRLGLKEQLTYVLTRALARTRTLRQRVKRRMWKIAYKSYVSTGRPLPHALRNITEINLQAARAYVRQIYPGQIILFRASEQPVECYPDPQLGWGGLAAGGLEIYEVPNDHDTMLRSPVLAEQVKVCLQQVQAAASSTQT
jgi:aspartate racemase